MYYDCTCPNQQAGSLRLFSIGSAVSYEAELYCTVYCYLHRAHWDETHFCLSLHGPVTAAGDVFILHLQYYRVGVCVHVYFVDIICNLDPTCHTIISMFGCMRAHAVAFHLSPFQVVLVTVVWPGVELSRIKQELMTETTLGGDSHESVQPAGDMLVGTLAHSSLRFPRI